MNFLAHIYLSGDNEQVRIGNFMADGIRGHDYEKFPADIKKGILLHRAIDSFTDDHPIFRIGTKRLHPEFHHYAGVVLDVIYDHFLAKNWSRYHSENLNDYANSFYRSLEDNFPILTDRVQQLLPIMKSRNWLVLYSTVEGFGHIMSQMDQRTGNKSGMRKAPEFLTRYYAEFESEFTAFFEDLRAMCQQKRSEWQD